MTSSIANRGRVTPAERLADDVVTGARAAMADYLGADPRGVVFGRSMTALTLDLARTLSRDWAAGTRSSSAGWTTTPTSARG